MVLSASEFCNFQTLRLSNVYYYKHQFKAVKYCAFDEDQCKELMQTVYCFLQDVVVNVHQQNVSVEEITADLMQHLKEVPEQVKN